MGSAAGHHSIHSHATENSKVLSNESDSSQDERVGTEEQDNTKEGKSGIETSSDEQEASDGEDQQECPHTQDTLTVLVSSLVDTRTPAPSPTLERKSRQHGKSSTRTAPRKTPVDHHLLKKSHQPTRHSKMGLGRKRGCLAHVLMLSIIKKLPTMLWAGQCKTP